MQYHNDEYKAFAEKHGIKAIKGVGGCGLGDGFVRHGGNSGHQAICLAHHFGATRIFLLGFDMGKTGGKNHFFGDHPNNKTNGNYSGFVPQFSKLASDLKLDGVEVINLSRATNLNQFKRATIEDYF